MTGAELRSARLAAGLTQAELGRLAGLSRRGVIRLERAARLDPGRVALRWCADALAERGVTFLRAATRGRASARGGVLGLSDAWCAILRAEDARLDERMAAELARIARREAHHVARRRVRCGARTRKGTACRALSEPGKRRCRFHGGRSTGPRTADGKARIAAAQRQRWARWREAQGTGNGGRADGAD